MEHDLSVLDYLSDFICCLYGKPGAYGVVTLPFSVREGINIFLAGFVPTENLRFRDESLTFKVGDSADFQHQNRMFRPLQFILFYFSSRLPRLLRKVRRKLKHMHDISTQP